jgi:hypothetical protein
MGLQKVTTSARSSKAQTPCTAATCLKRFARDLDVGRAERRWDEPKRLGEMRDWTPQSEGRKVIHKQVTCLLEDLQRSLSTSSAVDELSGDSDWKMVR